MDREGTLRLVWDAGSIKLFHDLEIYRFDFSGRPLAITRKNDIFRRGLNGQVLCIQRYHQEEQKFHSCRAVEGEERHRFLRSVVQKLESLRARLGREFERLEPALSIDLDDDARIFSELYGQVGILPPDCYRSLVLNLTQGCSYNQCSFCHFFKQQSYKLYDLDEFRAHIARARQAFGPSLDYRRGIFLGQANAANAPTPRLEEALAAVRDAFPSQLFDGNGEPRHPLGFDRVASFMDTFSQPGRSPQDWRRLRELGLKALYLGVESGSPEILKLLRKPGHPRQIKELVDILKAVGIEVNVIIMTGVGGKEMSSEHVAKSVELLNSLPLTAGDRVYLSDFLPDPLLQYARLAQARGLTEMTRLECRRQSATIREQLRFPSPPKGPSVTFYDVRQFVY